MVNICVYASSSSRTPSKYLHVSKLLGELIAEGGHTCVNGGGKNGCMGALNNGCSSKGGKIIGVIHETWVLDGTEDTTIKEMIVSKGGNLSERKNLLVQNSDCIIVLPGGVGTFDELWDSVSQKSLRMNGLDRKPICILNYDNYFDGTIIQLKRAKEENLLYDDLEAYFHVEYDANHALNWCISRCDSLRTETDDNNSSNIKPKTRDLDIRKLNKRATLAADNDYSQPDATLSLIKLYHFMNFSYGIPVILGIFYLSRKMLKY